MQDKLRRIQLAAKMGAVNFHPHALQRAAERNCSDRDIEHALKHATSVRPDPDPDPKHQHRLLVVGPDLEGDDMECCIKLTQNDWVLVITCGMEPRLKS